jgi:pimeloyl-ACP methyl ester carboxylesterase
MARSRGLILPLTVKKKISITGYPLRILGLLLPLLLTDATPAAELDLAPPVLAVPYGNNPSAGAHASINGIKLYYESYGTGQPMLQIHGNGQSISALAHQIAFFSPHYKVIVADSRGHGKSELGTGRLMYEQMAEDLNALLEKLKAKPVYVLGWSDGGILGLLLAIRHPDKVGKLAIMGANLNPEGAYDWALKWAIQEDRRAAAMIAKGDTSQPWSVMRQHLDLLVKQPHIPVADLVKVKAPTLVMSGDKDVIRDDHTLQIFHGIPQAQLAIFPGATHIIPSEDHELFNHTVARFFARPFSRPDTKNLFK